MSRTDRVAFFLLALTVFAYVIARAILVPFVHDEAATFSMYVPVGEFLPGHSHWNAGNHFLNTALGILGYKLFGMEQWALRGSNVLAFILYALMAYRLGRHLRDRLVRWCLWAALLFCPFLLDFFSLFRGYGLEMAFLLWALVALFDYLREPRTGQLVQVLIAFCSANACILSLLPVWAIVLGILFVLIVSDHRTTTDRVRQLVAWVLLGVLPLGFGARLAMEMQEIGLLYHGSTESFSSVTLSSLSWLVLGARGSAVLDFIVGIFLALTVVGVVVFMRDKSWKNPLIIVVGLLWAEVSARLMMAALLGVNFPEDRAALHLVPLFIIAIALAVDAISVRSTALRFAALLLLVMPLRTLVLANVDHTVLWPDESPPARFVDRLLALQAEADRALLVGCYKQMNASLPFAVALRAADLPEPQTAGFPEGQHDVRVVRDDMLEQALIGFHEVDHDPATGLHLLEPDAVLRLLPRQEHAYTHGPSDSEYIDVFRLDSADLIAGNFVEVSAHFSTLVPAVVKLVVEVRDKDDKAVYYDAVNLTAFKPRDHAFRQIRYVPVVPGGNQAVVYFWNVRRDAVTFADGSVRVFRSAEP